MNLRLTNVTAAKSAVILSLIAGCSEPDPTNPVAMAGTGGTAGVGTGGQMAGTAGATAGTGLGGQATGGAGAGMSGAGGTFGGAGAGGAMGGMGGRRLCTFGGEGGMGGVAAGAAGMSSGGMSAGGMSAGGMSSGGMSAGGMAGSMGNAGMSGGGMGSGGMAGMSAGGMAGMPSGGMAGMTSGGMAGMTSGGMAGMTSGGMAGGAGMTGRPATWETVRLIFEGTQPQCISSDCHGGLHPLNLTGDDATLRNTLTTHRSEPCGNFLVVDPGRPQSSALVRLLKDSCCDIPRMPNGCSEVDGNCVPDDYIAAVEQWILNGAMVP